MAAVVVAEDDDRQRELVIAVLRAEGHEVLGTEDGLSAIDAIRSGAFEVAVLDVMMPGLSGHDVCRIVEYEEIDIAVLMLTALGDVDDLVAGLEMGADDYLPKPYSPRELAARVRALARRFAKSSSVEQQIANLVVSAEMGTASCDGEPLTLTRKELLVLAALASHPEKVWSRRQLIDEAFGFDYDGLERSIDMHIVGLRRKLTAAGWHGQLVTVHGIGYTISLLGDG